MGKLLDCISPREEEFMASQKVFFVATAPLSPNHYVNVSPKAPGTSLAVLGPHKVAYADLTGSGAEAAANVQENGRMTIMFVNLEEGLPKILRLLGTARALPANHVDASLKQRFPQKITESPGFRGVFVLDVERVSTSCGYSMPILQFDRYRESLNEWHAKKGSTGMAEYRIERNSFSINGLDALCSLGQGVDYPRVRPVRKEGYVLGVVESDVASTNSFGASLASDVSWNLLRVKRIASRHAVIIGLMLFIVGFAIGRTT